MLKVRQNQTQHLDNINWIEDSVPAPVKYTSSMALNSSQINMCAVLGLEPSNHPSTLLDTNKINRK